MPSKALTLSIVIPVYNEQDHIGKCLDAISRQSVKPLEIIIVDNNCTDKTIPIAKKYSLVRVVKEPVQGRTVSRNRGFNNARGDILGRIDADSVLATDWVERVLDDFADDSISGVTGLGRARVMVGLPGLYSTFWCRAYYWVIHSFHRVMTMWGANMAIRASMWQQIKNDVAPNGLNVHEDQDISFIVVKHGGKITQDNKLIVTTEGGSFLYWPKYWDYVKKAFRMKKYHDNLGTLDNVGDLRLGFWSVLPGAIIGWILTLIFTLYSLLCWPFFKLVLHRDKYLLQRHR